MGKKGGANLGRQLTKSKTAARKKGPVGDGYLHTAELQDGYDWGRMNLKSVTEEASYIDFLNTAEQARTDFDAEKWNVKLLDAQTRQVYIDTGNTKSADERLTEAHVLAIPRKPDWKGLTPTELNDAENDAFLEWRRHLATIQEDTETIITPYEKNLEFWRQLWRVIERSDLVIQIVDCRNPLLFRSQDLEKYVKEVSPLKKNLILLNKADYLTDTQRKQWAAYLTQHIGQTKFAFFSAIQEDDATSEHTEEQHETQIGEIDEDDESENIDLQSTTAGPSNMEETEEIETKEEEMGLVDEKDRMDINLHSDPSAILTSVQLIELFRTFKRFDTEHITVGCIGYPNVGKSSTINKLLNSKKVRVSETPGKTKHFQTLILEDDITLCDCPGLVMPSIVSSKADMILNGILGVDQLRDHVPAIQLLLQRIPTHVLEYTYGIVLPQEPEVLNVEQVLTAHATMRGYMAIGGRPDQSRSARIILKEFVAGKLLYCLAPPTIPQSEFHIHPRGEVRVWHSAEAKQQEAQRLQRQRKLPQQELDEKFFAKMSVGTHIRGKQPLTGRLSDKKKKKQKARIVHKEFDPKHA